MAGNSDNISVVVDLDGSDNEDEGRRMTSNIRPSEPPLRSLSSPSPTSTHKTNHQLEFRSFWKAGGYDVASSKPVYDQGQLEHARVHPKFLHSNATSHRWAFGAIAELLDNAVDEISKGATFVKLDKVSNARDHSPALLFHDNGGGMDPGSMRQCMSLGYSNKKGSTIGQYGNGFKTSTMRLGADVIVFSRTTRGSNATQSIGLLSYTFLRKTGQDDVIVPMIDYQICGDRTQPIIYGSLDDWSSNLRTILEWSPFATEEELMLQFQDIGSHGTKVIVYNLWLNDDGLLELDFDNDEEDIRLRDEVNHDKSKRRSDRLIESHISYHLRFSLRAYASILYLRKFENFVIILRGKPVQQYNIVDDLKLCQVVMYKPKVGHSSKEVSIKTEIGFVKEAPLLGVHGFNVYHKNRLIRPFWRFARDGNSMGNGVVGVLEANFIEPAHDKQDFERSALYLKLEMRLKQMAMDFWKSHFHLITNPSYSSVVNNVQKECSTEQFHEVAANSRRDCGADQPVIGLSANIQQGMRFDQPVIGLAANIENLCDGQTALGHKDMSGFQPIIGLAADSQIQANASGTWNSREGSGHPGSSKNEDGSSSELVNQICEENIELFMRCEEHRQKETELKQTIEELERELAETKRKCSELSSHLQRQKKLQAVGRQTGKA